MSVSNRPIRAIPVAALAYVLFATTFAAAPPAQLQELDEVVVSAKTIIRLDDSIELPKYDSVTLSPSGTRLATGWIDVNNYSRAISLFEFPSMKPIVTAPVDKGQGIPAAAGEG
jgi:hypothetical protein